MQCDDWYTVSWCAIVAFSTMIKKWQIWHLQKGSNYSNTTHVYFTHVCLQNTAFGSKFVTISVNEAKKLKIV